MRVRAWARRRARKRRCKGRGEGLNVSTDAEARRRRCGGEVTTLWKRRGGCKHKSRCGVSDADAEAKGDIGKKLVCSQKKFLFLSFKERQWTH